MKHIKTKYIAVIDLRNSFGSTAEVDVTRSYNAEKVWDKTRESCAMYTKNRFYFV